MERGEKIRWIIISTLLATFLTVLGNIISNQLIIRDGKVNNAVSLEYVDTKQIEMKGYVDTQDQSIRTELREAKHDMNEDLKRIDEKLDNIYNILISRK